LDLFLWRAFKTKFKPNGYFQLKLNTWIRIFCEENFKGLSPSITPFERENFIRSVELMIPEAPNLSILKKGLNKVIDKGKFFGNINYKSK
jgi:hypothetical protein